jgi:hypothetical protein
MKTNTFIFLALLFIVSLATHAQNERAVYARTFANKVSPSSEAAYLKLLKEQIKPAMQLAKQTGLITGWSVYKVAFTGSESYCNYVSVFILNSWEKTENLPDLVELLKKVSPKTDGEAVRQQMNTLRTTVGQQMYRLVESVDGLSTAPTKYIMVDYMKPKEGQTENYLNEEREIWKPIHQEFAKSGQTDGWEMWSLLFPSGSNLPYEYVTVSHFNDYSKLNKVKYNETISKVFPNRTLSSLYAQTENTRTIARTELWLLVETLQ